MGRNTFSKAVTAGPQGPPGVGDMTKAAYDPANLNTQLTGTTVSKTVAQMQTLAGLSGFIVNQEYQISNAYSGGSVLNIIAISTSKLARTGYGTFQNSAMATSVDAILEYNLSSDKILYIHEPIRNNTVLCPSITDGTDTFQFDNAGWYNNTWVNLTITGLDASTSFLNTRIEASTITGGNFTNCTVSSVDIKSGSTLAFGANSVSITNCTINHACTVTLNHSLTSCTIGDSKTISTVQAHTDKSYIGDTSNFNFALDIDTALASNVLTVPDYIGVIKLFSTTLAATCTIKALTITSDIYRTFISDTIVSTFNNTSTLKFPTPSTSTVIQGNKQDFITFKKDDTGTKFLQVNSVQY